MKITNGKTAEYIEKVVVQDPNDKDFIRFSNTKVKVKPVVLANVLETDLKNKSIILNKKIDNQEVMLVGVKNIKKVKLGNSENIVLNTLNILDAFGDGSCIATYPLDGNTNDLSGKHNGTWRGTPSYSTGKFGKAANFTGSNEIRSNIGKLSKYSLSLWFNIHDRGNNSNRKIVTTSLNNNVSNVYIDAFFTNANGIAVLVKDNTANWMKDVIDYNCNVGEWYHAVLTFDGVNKVVELYVNGKSVGKIANTKMCDSTSGTLVLGNEFGYNNHFVGLIDQVRVFNRILSGEEVEEIYKEQVNIYKYNVDVSEPIKVVTKPFDVKVGIAAGMYKTGIPAKPMELIKIIDVDSDSIALEKPINGIVEVGDDIILNNELSYVTESSDTVNTVDIFGDSSCAALYTFDGNANDLSGKYNGTINKCSFEKGKFGQCLFTNIDHTSHVEVDNIPAIFDEINKTFSCWVANIASSLRGAIISSAVNSNKGGDRCNFTTTTLGVYQGSAVNYSSYPKDDDWHHYLFTTDSKGIRVYIDGKLVAHDSRTIVNDSGYKSYPAYSIGNDWYNIANTGTNVHTPNLKIDQVRIFNKSLTEEEVLKLYNESSAKYKYNLKDLKIDKNNLFISVKKPVELKVLEKGVNYIETIDPLASDLEVNDTIVVEDLINNNYMKALITSKKTAPVDTVNVLNVFGDNSCYITYPFDGNANDLSGEHNATWQGTEQYDIGKYGKAAKLDGKSYLVSKDAKVGFNDGNWAISLWVKPFTIDSYHGTGSYSELFRYVTDNGSDNGLGFDENHCVALGFYNDYHLTIEKNKKVKVVENKWHHIVLSLDSKRNIKVYLDKELIITAVLGGTSRVTNNVFHLGKSEQGNLVGLLDQVRIFNRALTDKEVWKLYNEQIIKCTLGVNLNLPGDSNIYVPDSTKLLNVKTIDIESDILTLEYEDYIKRSRAVRRRIQACGDVEILPPFTTDVDKLLK